MKVDPPGRSPGGAFFDRRQFLFGVAGASCILIPAAATGEDKAAGANATDASAPLYDGLIRNAEPLDQLHSIVVANGSDVLFAKSFRGPPIDRPVNIKSVSKTIVALLIGIAIDRGVLASVDDPIGDFVPNLIPDGAPAAVGAITVSDLLTMRAGLDRTSGPNYGAWVQSDNWVRYILSRPLVAEPGGRFLYSTGNYHLLGVILARLTNSTLHALARDWLGEPIGIQIPPWMRDPQGFYMGGNNMALTPGSLARIGQLVGIGCQDGLAHYHILKQLER